MHRSFVWIMFYEFKVSWLSPNHYTHASKLVCNSAADLRLSGTLRLTAKALCGSLSYLDPRSPELWIQNMDSCHFFFFSLISLMVSSLFSPSSSYSLYFHMTSFSHLHSLSFIYLAITLLPEWYEETIHCSRPPIAYSEENKKQKKRN